MQTSRTTPLPLRERVRRIYVVYAPEKIASLDNALFAFQGREEEMFRILTRKYGPEPSEDFYRKFLETTSLSDENELNNSSVPTIATAAPTNKIGTDTMRRYADRLMRLFLSYCPDKVLLFDDVLYAYRDNPEKMISDFTAVYGGEETVSQRRQRLVSFYSYYCPEKVKEVDSILAAYAVHEDDVLFHDLVQKYGPEPQLPVDPQEEGGERTASASPATAPPLASSDTVVVDELPREVVLQHMARRLTTFYSHYAPERLPLVRQVCETYLDLCPGNRGRTQLFEDLERKYGPDPSKDAPPTGEEDEVDAQRSTQQAEGFSSLNQTYGSQEQQTGTSSQLLMERLARMILFYRPAQMVQFQQFVQTHTSTLEDHSLLGFLEALVQSDGPEPDDSQFADVKRLVLLRQLRRTEMNEPSLLPLLASVSTSPTSATPQRLQGRDGRSTSRSLAPATTPPSSSLPFSYFGFLYRAAVVDAERQLSSPAKARRGEAASSLVDKTTTAQRVSSSSKAILGALREKYQPPPSDRAHQRWSAAAFFQQLRSLRRWKRQCLCVDEESGEMVPAEEYVGSSSSPPSTTGGYHSPDVALLAPPPPPSRNLQSSFQQAESDVPTAQEGTTTFTDASDSPNLLVHWRREPVLNQLVVSPDGALLWEDRQRRPRCGAVPSVPMSSSLCFARLDDPEEDGETEPSTLSDVVEVVHRAYLAERGELTAALLALAKKDWLDQRDAKQQAAAHDSDTGSEEEAGQDAPSEWDMLGSYLGVPSWLLPRDAHKTTIKMPSTSAWSKLLALLSNVLLLPSGTVAGIDALALRYILLVESMEHKEQDQRCLLTSQWETALRAIRHEWIDETTALTAKEGLDRFHWTQATVREGIEAEELFQRSTILLERSRVLFLYRQHSIAPLLGGGGDGVSREECERAQSLWLSTIQQQWDSFTKPIFAETAPMRVSLPRGKLELQSRASPRRHISLGATGVKRTTAPSATSVAAAAAAAEANAERRDNDSVLGQVNPVSHTSPDKRLLQYRKLKRAEAAKKKDQRNNNNNINPPNEPTVRAPGSPRLREASSARHRQHDPASPTTSRSPCRSPNHRQLSSPFRILRVDTSHAAPPQPSPRATSREDLKNPHNNNTLVKVATPPSRLPRHERKAPVPVGTSSIPISRSTAKSPSTAVSPRLAHNGGREIGARSATPTALRPRQGAFSKMIRF